MQRVGSAGVGVGRWAGSVLQSQGHPSLCQPLLSSQRRGVGGMCGPTRSAYFPCEKA